MFDMFVIIAYVVSIMINLINKIVYPYNKKYSGYFKYF